MGDKDSMILNRPGKNQQLTLQFDEGDDILDCLQAALKQKKLENATVIGVSGHIKSGKINYFLKNQFKSKELENNMAQEASGRYVWNSKKQKYDGDLHLALNIAAHSVSGTLVDGIAGIDFILKLKFVVYSDTGELVKELPGSDIIIG